ncbi:hypothetical protein TNIN_24941 [Trichonephila inaurata madagascariensis]|uniref:Uncharacterized protein n=1 Tax=Trichonephila inaurata madagascariensis TaxID=2747483 RepID=A0A8X6XH18_9ARAC|nr:hypothetical protein TNIN_24941 [Trichonephila inaurata madagascariensis]
MFKAFVIHALEVMGKKFLAECYGKVLLVDIDSKAITFASGNKRYMAEEYEVSEEVVKNEIERIVDGNAST